MEPMPQKQLVREVTSSPIWWLSFVRPAVEPTLLRPRLLISEKPQRHSVFFKRPKMSKPSATQQHRNECGVVKAGEARKSYKNSSFTRFRFTKQYQIHQKRLEDA